MQWRDSFQLANLAASKFRSRFKLSDADRAYVARTGWETLRAQAEKIVRERLAPAAPNRLVMNQKKRRPSSDASSSTSRGTATGSSRLPSTAKRSSRCTAARSARAPGD